jgi:hypothetical protein
MYIHLAFDAYVITPAQTGANPTTFEFATTTPALLQARAFFKIE